jgi:hypothetical protein
MQSASQRVLRFGPVQNGEFRDEVHSAHATVARTPGGITLSSGRILHLLAFVTGGQGPRSLLRLVISPICNLRRIV